MFDNQEELDKWLSENRDSVRAKIERGKGQLDRGDVVRDDQLDRYLAERKVEAANAALERRTPKSE